MKRSILILLFVVFLFGALGAQVNGQLTNLGDRYVLHVWGNHYERGYALGYLLGDNIMTIFSGYFFTLVAQNNVGTYNYFLNYHQQNYITEERYISEAEGVIAGMQDSGTTLYHTSLQRELNAQDILLVNAIVDIAYMQNSPELELGCSSLSSWGAATQNDPQLNGNLIITRLLDWTRHATLVANPLLVVHHPSEPDEYTWLSFTYPGLFGALSAITDYGAASFLNIGNNHSNVNPTNLSAVLLDARTGLERMDYNDDGEQNNEDLYNAIQDGNHISGTILHNVQQDAVTQQAMVIETNNTGTTRRFMGENSGVSGSNLAATNHFRSLYSSVYCSRYSEIIDSLNVNNTVTVDRQWNLMCGAGGVSSNLMMIQYQPAMGLLRWSVATTSQGAYTQPYQEFELSELFVQPSSVDDPSAPEINAPKLFPNPLRQGQNLRFSSTKDYSDLRIYNLKGQCLAVYELQPAQRQIEIGNLDLPSGIYLCRLNSGSETQTIRMALVR